MLSNGEKQGSYVFGLEHVPLPALVCDRKGYVLWTNAHFAEAIAKDGVPPGSRISDHVTLLCDELDVHDLPGLAKKSGRTTNVLIGGNEFSLYLEKMGMVFGCVFAPARNGEKNAKPGQKQDDLRASRVPPATDRILEVFLLLSQELNRLGPEEEIIPLFIRIYQDLFPGRLLCIKLYDGDHRSFEQVYANGRLREESHSRVRLTKEAVKEHGLDSHDGASLIQGAKVVTTYEYLPIFEDGITGFDVPLYDGTDFYGVLNFEYWKNKELLPLDKAIAVPIAHQMCASLRNSHLIAETRLLKEYLEKLLDQANAPVIVVNRDRRITVFNQAIERQTGFSRVDHLNRDLMTVFDEEEKERLTSILIRVMLGEQRSSVKVRIPHADGKREAHIVFNMAPIMSSHQELEGVILVGQDLTEIRSLQQQIIHSEKLATVGQIAAGVAHEVSNPLTSIAVYANYLAKKLDGTIDKADVEKIKRIVEASARIQSFTRELVTYGRPSREKAMLLEVRPLLERALSFCEHLLDKVGAEALVNVPGDIKRIHGIRGNLEQVFVNLITNACHALQGTGGTIRFDAEAVDQSWIRISVSDTGIGIPAERLNRIFEPFYSTKPEGLGTGLGLSIVRNILTEHNAEIEVESELGKGTVFSIRMPVKG